MWGGGWDVGGEWEVRRVRPEKKRAGKISLEGKRVEKGLFCGAINQPIYPQHTHPRRGALKGRSRDSSASAARSGTSFSTGARGRGGAEAIDPLASNPSPLARLYQPPKCLRPSRRPRGRSRRSPSRSPFTTCPVPHPSPSTLHPKP